MYLAGDGAIRNIDTGYFTITGRIDDVLNVSGHRMGTMEIESALVSHERVAEAAVVGRPDEMTGEAICAFVVLKGERPKGDAAKQMVKELQDWVEMCIRDRYPDGQKRKEWTARRGPVHGVCTEWHSDGSIKSVANYMYGVETSYEEWSGQGALITKRELDEKSPLHGLIAKLDQAYNNSA